MNQVQLKVIAQVNVVIKTKELRACLPAVARKVRRGVQSLGGSAALCFVGLLASALGATAAQPEPKPGSTWPQPYSVQRDETAGILALRTPFYTVEHDLRKGGAIARISADL